MAKIESPVPLVRTGVVCDNPFMPLKGTSSHFMCVPRSGLAVCACALSAGIAHSQVSKGNQILINRGLQVQGMVTAGDVFSLTTYQNARYTSINWLWDSNPSLMGVAPGFQWSRWVIDETKVPPQGTE